MTAEHANNSAATNERQRWLDAIKRRIDDHQERLVDGGPLLPADMKPLERRLIEERIRGALYELRALCRDLGHDITEAE